MKRGDKVVWTQTKISGRRMTMTRREGVIDDFGYIPGYGDVARVKLKSAGYIDEGTRGGWEL